MKIENRKMKKKQKNENGKEALPGRGAAQHRNHS
jgi:hypothetical protein